ncbi:hypothetical protein HYFRA_00007003 [Hymenoscyphus fraxineus]|uniref:Sulfhydryl oxidase n=1 Tax=Hymenoscyphus fraxineus TaxID=746836 RepID=A0A9N9KP20_9HELO|nr:hypothetical protein HYFRA_00007003 [Hymenoscyphus fraxineus]
MTRRQRLAVTIGIGLAIFLSFTFILSTHSRGGNLADSEYLSSNQQPLAKLDDSILKGTATAAKIENATLKAELGHASWKLFHTMMAKFPDKPTPDDSAALNTYIHLFARLYPCGDCARHFQKILKKFPPQVATRSTAAAWACHVHNEVNKRLKKPLFDCSNIGDFYDCGCAEDPEDKKKGGKEGLKEKGKKDFTPLTISDKEGTIQFSPEFPPSAIIVMDFGTSGNLNEDGIHVDMDRLKKGEVNLGTSIMAINFKDGVILGADSRTTTGSYIANRVTDKLTQVSDTIWCCRSGSAADTQAVADIVHYQLGMYGIQNGRPPTTQTAAAMFQELCYDNKDRLSAGLIIAGWDERHGGQVYSIPLGGSLHKQSYAIGGSGSTYIYGYCDANWKEGMEEKEAVDFVKGALQEAIKWDGSSGGVIRMVVLTAKGANRHLYLPDTDYAVRHQ